MREDRKDQHTNMKLRLSNSFRENRLHTSADERIIAGIVSIRLVSLNCMLTEHSIEDITVSLSKSHSMEFFIFNN